jgi:hypothetical protein
MQISLPSQCERALALWHNDLLKYEGGSLKMNRTSAQHDFSGTNYRSCTLGWLAGIQRKRRTDRNFFGRVCDEAYEIAQQVMGKGKLSGADVQYSDCEIADRAEIDSDADESDGKDINDQMNVPGPSQDHSNGDEHLNST